jgi:hypothetical protein
MSDIYKITKRGRFHWELAIIDRRWGIPPFHVKRYWTKRSAERTVRWHQAYKCFIGKNR